MNVEYRILDFLGFDNYRVGSDGSVWRGLLDKINATKKWRQLKGWSTGGDGEYLAVTLSKHGKKSAFSIHKLVAAAFLGQRPLGLDICHNDGNGRNNDVSNLRYDTRKSNVADAKRHGTLAVGERCSWSKLTDNDVLCIRAMAADGATYEDIGSKFNVDCGHISNIVNGLSWSHLPLGAKPPRSRGAPRLRMTIPDVVKIKELTVIGKTCNEISAIIGRSRQTVSSVLFGGNWKSVFVNGFDEAVEARRRTLR